MSELIFGSSDPQEAYKISKLLKAGKIRKLSPRIYSTNFGDEASEIIRRNLLEILSNLYEGAVLSHRSAFEFKPTDTNQIFLTYSYTKKIQLPGVTINFIKGMGPVDGDNNIMNELFVSSRERAFLENLQITKKAGPDSKTLALPQIEEKLDDILRINGEEGLNKVRGKSRKLSKILGMEREFDALNKVIGALLSTKPSKILKSDLALARAAGLPYDKNRKVLFEILFEYLYNKEFKVRSENNLSTNSFRNFAFFEAYFSNYIEGTVFEVEEAKEIVDRGVPLPARGEDSHDILGTYHLVVDKDGMRITPSNEKEFIDILHEKHRTLLSARLNSSPGEFKNRNNKAGNTHFVDFKLVLGTLQQGFKYYNMLQSPFAKACYMMFMVSEVHPFNDGNGRIARVMMNSELVKGEQCKIIIPTAYRDDYLLTLKRLSNQNDPAAYVEMLSKAHQFSENLNFERYDDLYQYLMTHNAFFEPEMERRLIIDKAN